MLKFFWIIVFLLFGFSCCFWTGGDSNVAFDPIGTTYCTSQNVTVTCVVKDLSQFNASDLTMRVGGDANIQYSGISVLNESAAAITLWNFTKPNTYPTICCKQKSGTTTEKCISFLIRDYPVPVTDFKCIVQDWTESMNCTWKPGTDYVVIPKVSFEWRYPYSSCGWIPCPEYSKDYCYWNSTVGHDFALKLLNFRVDVTATCGVTVNSYFTVNTRGAVQPAPMENLQAEVLNSTCIKVTWEASRLEFVKIYEIWNTSRWSNAPKHQVFMANDTGTVIHNEAVFCDLVPATLYTFTGRVKPGKKYWSSADNIHTACEKVSCSNTIDEDFECVINEGYWSDEKTITATTFGDIPSASPEVTPGGYWWDPKDCGSSESYRTVSFYWKLVRDIHQNGQIQGYVIRIDPQESSHSRANLAGYANYGTENLRCDVYYNISIKPKNANGTSKEVSTIKILDSRKGIYPPSFRVEMSYITDDRARKVHILWTAVSRPDVTGFTVFWCKREKGQCASFIPDSGGDSTNDENEVYWKLVGPEENSTDLSILLPEDYLYSVSMETKSGSSGMTWQSCIYTAGVVPKRAPTGVEIHTGTENRALLVYWKQLACLSGEPYINIYEIEYCVEGRCKDETTKDNSIILRDLEAEKLYKVKVRGVSSMGKNGPWSDEVEKMPVDNSLKPGAIAGIFFGALMGLIILISCLILTYKKCYIRIKKTVEKPISVPPVEDYENENYIPKENENVPINEEGKHTPPYEKQMSILSGESGYEEGEASSHGSNRSHSKGFFNDSSKKHLQPAQIVNDGYAMATQVVSLPPQCIDAQTETRDTRTITVEGVRTSNKNMQNDSQGSINQYVLAGPSAESITSFGFNEQDDNMKRNSETEVDTYSGSTSGLPGDLNSERSKSAASGANAGGSENPDYYKCHMEDTENPSDTATEKIKMGKINATATDYVKHEVQSGASDQEQGCRKLELSISSMVDQLDDGDLQPHYSSSSESHRIGGTSGRGLKLTDVKLSSVSDYVSQDLANASEQGFEEDNAPDPHGVVGVSKTIIGFETNYFENDTTEKTASPGYVSEKLLNCPESNPDRLSQYLDNDTFHENADFTENDLMGQHADLKDKMHKKPGLELNTDPGYISEDCLIAKELVGVTQKSATVENTENKLNEDGHISEATAHDLETKQDQDQSERLDIHRIMKAMPSTNPGNNLLHDMPKHMTANNSYVPHTFLGAHISLSDGSFESDLQDETGNAQMDSSLQGSESEHNSGYVPHHFITKL